MAATKVSKGYKGLGMEGFIARWYAKNTEKGIEDFRKEARRVADHVRKGAAVLEVAPGPGYLAIELARLGNYKVTGLDISATFVEMAQARAQEEGVKVDFRLGNASQMPFEGNTFDFIVCRAAFKNFSEPVAALDEMYRVLKPGGKALIIDLRGDVAPDEINEHVDAMGLSRLNTLFTKLAFKHMLIKRAYTQEQFKAMAAQSKFRHCEIEADPIGMSVWLEK